MGYIGRVFLFRMVKMANPNRASDIVARPIGAQRAFSKRFRSIGGVLDLDIVLFFKIKYLSEQSGPTYTTYWIRPAEFMKNITYIGFRIYRMKSPNPIYPRFTVLRKIHDSVKNQRFSAICH